MIYIINSDLTGLILKGNVDAMSDSGGNIVVIGMSYGIPIALITDSSHYVYSFFWAGDFWYAKITSAYHDIYKPITNAQITGTLYYITI